jgi:GMP synthase (glutamine-hydrolysing)
MSNPAKAIAIRHVLFEDLGILRPLLERRGYEVEYLDAGIDDLGEALTADLLVVLGGPIGVGDIDAYPFLGEEIRAIGARLGVGGPTLGICLGAQLMAAALGAEVYPTGRTEIGFGELELTPEGEASVLAGLAGTPVFHWHGDEFAIPEGAERLASTEGFLNQAFALGNHALALQFHIEADPRYLERWLIGHSGELASAGIDPASLRADASRYGATLAELAEGVIDAWLPKVR